MLKVYKKLFVMLLALGVAGQVLGVELVKQKKVKLENFVEGDGQKKNADTLNNEKDSLKIVKKKNMKKSLRTKIFKKNVEELKSQQVPSVKLARKDCNIYVVLQKVSVACDQKQKRNVMLAKPFYKVPVVLKDSKDAGVKFKKYAEFDNDSCIWVKVGSYCEGVLTLDNQESYAKSFKDKKAAVSFKNILETNQAAILTHYATSDLFADKQPESQSFLDSTLGKTIVYGSAAAVTALVGWWWFSRAK